MVRGTNWVGDSVITVPALRKLRKLFPDAHITLATRSVNEGLFLDANFIDDLQLHAHTGVLSTIGQIRETRKGRFDLAVLFPNSFGAALVPFLAGVPIRIGYATGGRRLLLTHPLNLPEWRSSRHEVYYYLEVVNQLEPLAPNIERRPEHRPDDGPDASLSVSESRRKAVADLLDVREDRLDSVDHSNPLIALCPGSINSRAKRWPAERYAALADRLVDDLGANILLVGSSGELEISTEVSRLMKRQPIVLTGQTELAEAIAILSLVDLLVTNDTGPAHIASALGRPTLVIFGPTNPLTTGPFSEAGEILRHPPDCAPCMLRDCPIDHRCMTAISSDEVFERARTILGSSNLPQQAAAGGARESVESTVDVKVG